MTDFPPFPGFRPEALEFLKQLAQNNDRSWFKPRKTIYEDEVLWPLRCLISDVTRETQARGIPLSGDPKGAVFRIYRDTRFSKDKRPYKTHAAALLTRTGDRRVHIGSFYIHIEPNNCLMGAGFWRAETSFVRQWRARMAQNPDQFFEMVNKLDASGLKLETDEQLKRLPRGFDVEPAAPIADYMRWKSFLTSRNVAEEEIQRPDFTETVVQTMVQTLPLLEYGWAISEKV